MKRTKEILKGRSEYWRKWEARRPLTTEELMTLLEESDDDDDFANAEGINLTLFPPNNDDDTDIDDLPEEELVVNENNLHQLGKGILALTSEIQIITKDKEKKDGLMTSKPIEDDNLPSTSSEIPTSSVPKKQKLNATGAKKKEIIKKVERTWVNIDLRPEAYKEAGLKIKNICWQQPAIIENMLQIGGSPLQFFQLFWDSDLVKYICEETEKYAKYKCGDNKFTVTEEDMYKVLAILLVSGYNRLPNRKMYWETKADVHNAAISSAMSRDRFLSIFKYLHFCDNNAVDITDKCRKVRPLLDNMSSKFENYAHPLPKVWSFDEAMEPYYGRHHMKQFIRGKPIRFGYKFWCLNTPDGYCVRFKLYEGREERVHNMSLGSWVTQNLVSNFVPEGSHVLIDNYFNSFSLLEEMTRKNIYITGTIRSDRIEKAPLKDLKKQPRGTIHALKDEAHGIHIYRWHDNSQVTLATNRTDALVSTRTKCSRCSSASKTKVDVSQPSLIAEYNNGMGGVDVFDQCRGAHRIIIRSKKWYWPIVRFCLNGSVVNAWLLFRYVEPGISQLEFIRRITIPLLSTPMIHRSLMVAPHRSSNILQEVRFDRKDHWPLKNPTQRRRARCNKAVTHICSKCNVALHIECFKPYHTQK